MRPTCASIGLSTQFLRPMRMLSFLSFLNSLDLGLAALATVRGLKDHFTSGHWINMGSSGGTNTVQNNNAQPWAPQTPFITQGLNSALSNYNTAAAAGPYTGNFTAGGNGYFDQAANQQQQLGTASNDIGLSDMGTGNDIVAYSAGNNAVNAGNLYNSGIGPINQTGMNTINGMAAGNTGITGPTAGLSSALNSGATAAASQLGTFASGLSGASAEAAQNPNSQILSNAQSIENSAPTQSAISSTNAQLQQVLNEQTVPQLNRSAASAGNLNSSRAGMAEAMANENEGIVQGNADASILNNAFNTGLGTANSEYGTQLNGSINANTSGLNAAGNLGINTGQQQTGVQEANSSQMLNAANAGVGNQINYGVANTGEQLNANSQIGASAQLGEQLEANGQSIAANGAGALDTAGSTTQANQNADFSNELQQWEMQNQYPTGILNNYMTEAGQPYGSSDTINGQTSTTGPGTIASLLGLGVGTAGLAQAANTAGLFNTGSLFGSGGAVANGVNSLTGGSLGLGSLVGSGVGGAAGMVGSDAISSAALAAGGTDLGGLTAAMSAAPLLAA